MQPYRIGETAAAVGRYRYVELRLFALTGERSATVASAPLAVFLAGASSSHGYRAGLFDALLPVSTGLGDLAALTADAGEVIDRAIDAIGQLGDAELFAALVDVAYPSGVNSLTDHLGRLSSACDGPLERTLRRVLFDFSLIDEQATALRAELELPGSAGLAEVTALVGAADGLYG